METGDEPLGSSSESDGSQEKETPTLDARRSLLTSRRLQQVRG